MKAEAAERVTGEVVRGNPWPTLRLVWIGTAIFIVLSGILATILRNIKIAEKKEEDRLRNMPWEYR